MHLLTNTAITIWDVCRVQYLINLQQYRNILEVSAKVRDTNDVDVMTRWPSPAKSFSSAPSP